jgi:hypothetical protein
MAALGAWHTSLMQLFEQESPDLKQRGGQALHHLPFPSYSWTLSAFQHNNQTTGHSLEIMASQSIFSL